MGNSKIITGIPAMRYSEPSTVCYVGSVMRLLEHLGDPIAEDELFALSGAGLFWAWKKGSSCDEVSIDLTIPTRTFDALGYESEYISDAVKPGAIPGALSVGVWPLPEGNYDPALTDTGIPEGTSIYGLFDSAYNKLPMPDAVDGYKRVDTFAELTGKTYTVIDATSGFSYVIVSGDETTGTDRYPKELYFNKIKESIDAGRPVIGFGITTKNPYTCLIVGYDENGLFTRSFWTPNNEPCDSDDYFYSVDWYEKCAGIQIVGEKTNERLTGAAAYERIAEHAIYFRNKKSATADGQTIPMDRDAFTEMRNWLLDDTMWQTDEQIRDNEQWLYPMGILLLKHYRRNTLTYLRRLNEQYPDLVNPPALTALENIDALIPRDGELWNAPLAKAVDAALTDFSVMRDGAMRKKVADYIEMLEHASNRIQWALFMPSFVKRQIKGFELKNFEYLNMPAMRFIGRETTSENRQEIKNVLDRMTEYASRFNYDIQLTHHNGINLDAAGSEPHFLIGRFMKADTPVPEGFLGIDFIPEDNGRNGIPYVSRFAFAEYTGDWDAMHTAEGFDASALYDTTRNIVLGDDELIPYPGKYWTAEVFFKDGENGENSRAGFIFSVSAAEDVTPVSYTAKYVMEAMTNKLSALKTLKLNIPATRFIGKKYGDEDRENGGFGHKWGEFFENNWAAVIENSPGYIDGWIDNAGWYDGSKSYAGLMRWAKDEPFQYWIGIFCAPDTVVPDGFGHIDFPESVIGDCVIQAFPGDIYGQDEFVMKCFKENDIQASPDESGAWWFFERETETSHMPDKDGLRILEHCYFLHETKDS